MLTNFIKFASFMLFGAALSACAADGDVSAKMAAETECEAGKDLGASSAGLALVQLCITSSDIVRAYISELAATPQEQANGLMFRKSLGDDAAMIFPFPEAKSASFWMKNTLIPLDIIFIRSDGTIETIAENTVPYSEIAVSSAGPVAAVLELRGGLTRELGIKSGDLVRWQ